MMMTSLEKVFSPSTLFWRMKFLIDFNIPSLRKVKGKIKNVKKIEAFVKEGKVTLTNVGIQLTLTRLKKNKKIGDENSKEIHFLHLGK